MTTTKKAVKMVPPDGGWGWVAVFGVSLVNMATRSIEPSFGLLFGDLLKDIGVATTGAALIMSTMDAMINLSGFLVGPLCKYLSLRKVSLIGSALNAVALIITFPATTMSHLLMTYSIIGGIGTGLASSATFVALNHYFYNKRGQAVGLSLAGTAVGMMLFPQAVTLLLDAYGFRGAVLIIGAINLHSIVGSLLLQPAKWHFKPAPVESNPLYIVEMETITENDNEENLEMEDNLLDMNRLQLKPENQLLKLDVPKPSLTNGKLSSPELQALHSGHTPKKTNSAIALNTWLARKSVPRNVSAASLGPSTTAARKRKDSIISNLSSMDFTGSSIQLHLTQSGFEKEDEVGGLHFRRNLSYTSSERPHSPIQMKNRKKFQRFWGGIYNFLDLDLLRDGIYLNLLLGLSLFYVAEQNFKMVTPFFFASLGYTRADTAFCLSTTAVMDILARIVLPPICDRLAPNIIRRKTIFMITSVFLAITRSFLAVQTEWHSLLIWFTISGFFRGAVLINFTLTVSEWCPTLEKLPAAFGLQMVSKGIFVIIFGPLLGFIRDETNSYQLLLHTQNVLILMCVFVWTVEYIYLYCRQFMQKKL